MCRFCMKRSPRRFPEIPHSRAVRVPSSASPEPARFGAVLWDMTVVLRNGIVTIAIGSGDRAMIEPIHFCISPATTTRSIYLDSVSIDDRRTVMRPTRNCYVFFLITTVNKEYAEDAVQCRTKVQLR